MPRPPSAGLLVFRDGTQSVEVLLGHMGGPFWARKDDAAWSIPKGEYEPGESAFAAARREFEEELGQPAPEGNHLELGASRQSGGKLVSAWAVRGDLDVTTVLSNTFEIEWPPHSGRRQAFPELDRAGWFDLAAARLKIVKGQAVFLERLAVLLRAGRAGQEWADGGELPP